MEATRTPERVAMRAKRQFTLDPSTGCHVSSYSVGSHGYPQIGWHDRTLGRSVMTLVHRVIWEGAFGAIPEDMTVDHMCKRRTCCNVAHLRLLSNFENARRTGGRDWPVGRCVNGHPNSELHTQPSGKRICRPCNAEHQRRYNDKRKAS